MCFKSTQHKSYLSVYQSVYVIQQGVQLTWDMDFIKGTQSISFLKAKFYLKQKTKKLRTFWPF